jgi:membrane protease YdiL (CAAX protease family)
MAATHPVLIANSPNFTQRSRARRGLAIFFSVLVPLTALLETLIITTQNNIWIVVLMLVPTVASVVARLMLREGFADVSFRLGGQRGLAALALAVVLPVLIGGGAYGIAWASGLAQFVAIDLETLIGISCPEASPLMVFGVFLVLSATVLMFVNGALLLSAGEEIGWRGYMLTRLIDAGVPAPILLSGVIWGLWHSPLILAGSYAAGPSAHVSVALFMVTVTAISVVFARLRLETGSVWPAVVLHAAWNSVIQGPFDHASAGPMATLWVGESGILVMLVVVAAAVVLGHGRWNVVRSLTPPTRDPQQR